MGGLVSRHVSRLDAFSASRSPTWLPGAAPGGTTGAPAVGPSGPLVLGKGPVSPPTPVADRDRTVSRRSEPSSRTALMGEQPNPWDLLQPRMRRADIEVPNLASM